MTTPLNFGRDVQGYNAYAPAFSTDNYSATLAATTNTTLTVPAKFTRGAIAVFTYNSSANVSVWVAVNATAAIPAGATFASTTSFNKPATRFVQANDVLNFFSSGTPDVGVTFYAIS